MRGAAPRRASLNPARRWRPGRADGTALLGVALLPVLMAVVQAAGFCRDNPALFFGYLATGVRFGWLVGYQHIDGDIAYTTQALGHLAAADWLHGVVPWWNPYSGIGLPLAAEYQPAALFPPTLLLALPDGSIWRLMALKLIAGFGVYGLLRQLGLGRLAALTGAVLYEHNGTFSWLADAPSGPVAVFPWVLLGVERAAVTPQAGRRGGWRLLAVATGLMLLAGFPETAYICGLFALAWAALRWAQASGRRRAVAWRLLLAGAAGLALAAPQLLAFAEFLPLANAAGHEAGSPQWILTGQAAIPSLLAPFVYGPIWGYEQWAPSYSVWNNVGGYVDALALAAAGYGFWVRRDALSWLLVISIILALTKSFGLPPLAGWWNLIPGIDRVFVYRYAQPCWELATVILACFAVDSAGTGRARRGALAVAATILGLEMIVLAVHACWAWPREPFAGLHDWLMVSTFWALLTSGLAVGALALLPGQWRARALAALLAADACMLFAIPALCNPRAGAEDLAAIGFLQRNLGLQRFFTLGPITPNFGAYYGLAGINHYYAPVALSWVDWVRRNLDGFADPVSFTGTYHDDPLAPYPADELRAHLAGYEQAGVKYVVTPAGRNPFYPDYVPLLLDKARIAVRLQPGQNAQGVIPASVITIPAPVHGLGVMLGNDGNLSDGALKFTLCAGGRCVSGSAALAGAVDNRMFWMPLPQIFTVPAHLQATYNIEHLGGTRPVDLWAYPEILQQSLTGPEGQVPGYGLPIQLLAPPAGAMPAQVYGDSLMDIYQLPAPAPYFEAGGCALQARSRTQVIADCKAPATLLRRELFFPGWEARVNGKPAALSEQDGIFQALRLSAGRNTVRYAYAPPYIDWAWLLMWLALAGLAMPGGWPKPAEKARARSAMAPAPPAARG
jgi:hypothetical protein